MSEPLYHIRFRNDADGEGAWVLWWAENAPRVFTLEQLVKALHMARTWYDHAEAVPASEQLNGTG